MTGADFMVAIVVPIVSAIVGAFTASQLSFHDTRRQLAMEAFLKIRKDLQDFRVAILKCHPQSLRGVPDAERWTRQQELHWATNELDGNCLRLGLLFDKKADPLGEKIAAIAGRAELITLSPASLPTFDQCQELLNRDVTEACHAIKPLWKSVASGVDAE